MIPSHSPLACARRLFSGFLFPADKGLTSEGVHSCEWRTANDVWGGALRIAWVRHPVLREAENLADPASLFTSTHSFLVSLSPWHLKNSNRLAADGQLNFALTAHRELSNENLHMTYAHRRHGLDRALQRHSATTA
jgi:hypothetical protein